MPREFSRVDRVEEAIHRGIADMLRREVGDPRLALLTVSRVKVSRDLAHAKIYLSSLTDGAAGDAAFAALRHAAGFLRSGLARRLKMRTVPELSFVRDTSLADGNRLVALIDEATAGRPEDRTVSDDE